MPPTTTTQLTSKRLKAHSAAALVLFVVAAAWLFSGDGNMPAVALTLAALGWFVVTRLRIWWHHD